MRTAVFIVGSVNSLQQNHTIGTWVSTVDQNWKLALKSEQKKHGDVINLCLPVNIAKKVCYDLFDG